MNEYDFISQLQRNIDERVPSERDRLILTMKFIKGYTHEKIADCHREYKIIDIEARQIRRVCKKYKKLIYKGIDLPKL